MRRLAADSSRIIIRDLERISALLRRKIHSAAEAAEASPAAPDLRPALRDDEEGATKLDVADKDSEREPVPRLREIEDTSC